MGEGDWNRRGREGGGEGEEGGRRNVNKGRESNSTAVIT